MITCPQCKSKDVYLRVAAISTVHPISGITVRCCSCHITKPITLMEEETVTFLAQVVYALCKREDIKLKYKEISCAGKEITFDRSEKKTSN